jgi:hypothetical protein
VVVAGVAGLSGACGVAGVLSWFTLKCLTSKGLDLN